MIRTIDWQILEALASSSLIPDPNIRQLTKLRNEPILLSNAAHVANNIACGTSNHIT